MPCHASPRCRARSSARTADRGRNPPEHQTKRRRAPAIGIYGRVLPPRPEPHDQECFGRRRRCMLGRLGRGVRSRYARSSRPRCRRATPAASSMSLSLPHRDRLRRRHSRERLPAVAVRLAAVGPGILDHPPIIPGSTPAPIRSRRSSTSGAPSAKLPASSGSASDGLSARRKTGELNRPSGAYPESSVARQSPAVPSQQPPRTTR